MAQVQPVGNPALAAASDGLAYGTPQNSSGSFHSLKPRPCGQPIAGPQVCIAPGPPSSASTPQQQQAHQQGPLGAAYAAASPSSALLNFSPASSGAPTGPCTPEHSAASLRLSTTPEPSSERSQSYASPTGSLAPSSGGSFSSTANQSGYNLSPMPAGSRFPSVTGGSGTRVSPNPGATLSGNTLQPLPSPFSGGNPSSVGQLGHIVLPTASQPVQQQHSPMPSPAASATATLSQTSAAASFNIRPQPAASLPALKPANPSPVSAYPSNPVFVGPATGPAAQPAPISFRPVGLTPSPAPVTLSTTGQQQQQQYPQPGGQQHYVGLPRPSPTPEQHQPQRVVGASSQPQLQPRSMLGHPVTMPVQPAGESAYPPGAASIGGSGLGYGHQGHYPPAASGPIPVQPAAFPPTMTHPQHVDHTPQHGPCYHTSKPCHQHNNKAAKKALAGLGTLLGACLVGMCEAACDN
ncbi:hypothetical protein N2152v2_004217 [Parachlorella kessleri]